MNLTPETKVGAFALAALVVIGVITLKIGSRSFIFSGGYEIKVTIDEAIGLRTKTPVEIAGIKVGQIKKIELSDSRRAVLTLLINKGVELPLDTKAFIRTKGFIGETLIELIPGTPGLKPISNGEEIQFAGQAGNLNLLMSQFSGIAEDIRAVTASMKNLIADDKKSPFWNIVNNLDKFTATLAGNQSNFDKVADNLAALTDALRGTIAESRENVEESLARIASITKKVDEGKGTVGKLVNDDETVTKLNEAIDNLNNTLGGLKQLETEIGFHTEYMTSSEDFKNYVNLTLKPKPDKSFIFDFVQDPAPSPDRQTTTTTINAGGTTSTVTTSSASVSKTQFRVSAQFAKQFYDVIVRGGIIESRGGFGLDYSKGPFGLQFSAFDFETKYDQRPHLKAAGSVNVTRNIYLTSGIDDMLNKQDEKNWFVGAGFRLIDDDIKSLISMGSGAVKGK